MTDLFSPVQLGDIQLGNRIIMAPMTRSRAGAEDEALPMTATYYAQRASAGLIITEGVYPCPDGKGYVRSPGIVTDRQIESWTDVAKRVHDNGGKIVMQLMHCGRIASAHNKAEDARTLAPSPIKAAGEIYTDAAGMAEHEQPEEMTFKDIEDTVTAFADAAQNAVNAGFDGVECHFTSGYLPAQFLSTGANHRTDSYGGSLENRLRFPLEILHAVSARIGAGRVGFRICPGNRFNDLHDDDPKETFSALLAAASPMNLAYLHVIRMDAGVDNIALAQNHFTGPLIINESYGFEEANKAVGTDNIAAVSFGRPFIANPDLVNRFQKGLSLSKPDFSTLYTTGEKGYIDYSTA
ncbi:MAG: alkene reductase [Parvibaculales bacterium]